MARAITPRAKAGRQGGEGWAIEADCVVQDEAAFASEGDAVAQGGVVDLLLHGGAAEDEAFDAEESGVGGAAPGATWRRVATVAIWPGRARWMRSAAWVAMAAWAQGFAVMVVRSWSPPAMRPAQLRVMAPGQAAGGCGGSWP